MRIGELATQVGVSARALRYYEEQGLLHAQRSPAGQRSYPETAVGRVKLIRSLLSANLSSRTIAELLPCADKKVTPEMARARLAVERERIDAQIIDLTAARDQLDAVTALIGLPTSGCRYQVDEQPRQE